MLALSDRELLAVSSTSPDVEDDRFVADVRRQFRYILAHAGADGDGWWQNVFGGGRGSPLVYPRSTAVVGSDEHRQDCGSGGAHMAVLARPSVPR